MDPQTRVMQTPRYRLHASHRHPDDPLYKAVELAQRGRMILDVAEADLDEAEARLGATHPTTWHFRNTLAEARCSWDRLREEFGNEVLDEALTLPPVTYLNLAVSRPGRPPTVLVPIAGKTYRVERVQGTSLAPVQFRVLRLPPQSDGPYYVCRLQDGSTQCDCAEWTYRVSGIPDSQPCKHLAALSALGWL